MVKSVIRKSTYQAIYRLLDKVSPLEFDCGLLCGAACCRDDQVQDGACECIDITQKENCGNFDDYTEDGSFDIIDDGSNVIDDDDFELGMEMLPGEDKIHDKNDDWLSWSEDEAEDMEYPESWKGKVFFVKCSGPESCNRRMRPVQCRTFPLAPHIIDGGRLIMILNPSDELTYVCPLTDSEMVPALDRRFVKATYTVWKRLVTDPLIFDLVEMDSELRENVTVVYDPEGYYVSGQLLWLG